MEALPHEILLQILKYLDFRGWNVCTSVSRAIRTVASDNKLWARHVHKIWVAGGPTPRVCHSSVVSQGKMFIFGGHNPERGSNYINDVKNELFMFDFQTQTWTQVVGSNFPFRTEHSSVCHNGKLITFGGYSGLGGYKNDITICDLHNGFQWEPVIHPQGDYPSPRSAHSVVLYKNKVYIFGGWDGRTSNNLFYQFNLDKMRWKKIISQGSIPEPRRSHGAVVIGDSMYIFGGYDGQKNVPPHLHRYCFKSKRWTIEPAKGNPPCGRSRAKLIHYHNTVAVFGGWDRQVHFQKWHEYNLDTQTWCEIDIEFPGKGVGQHSAVIYNNSVYVFGGYSEEERGSSALFWGYFLGHLGRNSSMA